MSLPCLKALHDCPLADTRCSDYRPELDKLVEERKAKSDADKKAQLDRLMKDMSMSEKPDKKGENPFGPFPSHDRVDL